jgi:histidine ammonia-lyase
MPLHDVSSPQETAFPWMSSRFFLKEAQDLASAKYRFELDALSLERVKASALDFERHLQAGRSIYGTHTHFGAQVARACSNDYAQHQKELVHFLKVGTGRFFKEEVVRRALRLQAKKMAQGFSGISIKTLLALIDLSNRPELSCVPQEGSLGASGDLIPMAHALGSLFNEISPAPRDALALVNTNAMMVSHAIDLFLQVKVHLIKALGVSATLLAAIHPSLEFLSLFEIEALGLQRPTSALVAKWMKEKILSLSEALPEVLQDQPRYSLRCSPIVYGLVFDLLEEAEKKIELEYHALADNPIMTPEALYHGGLFYAVYLASASDQVIEAVCRSAEMLDRQILLLMDPEHNGGLSINLEHPLASHCKGLHQLISSLYQRLRSFGVPAWQMSFSAESNNQDIVPASMQAWHRIQDLLPLLDSLVQAAEFCASRALDLRKGKVPAPLESWRESQEPPHACR